MVRVRDRLETPNCRDVVRCFAERCDLRTRDGKPYCPDHVELHPYVQELQAMLAEQRGEIERVERRGVRAVDPSGLTANELMLQLKLYGDRTVERLARDLQLPPEVVEAYARGLAREGKVSLSHTRRGHVQVTLLISDVHIPGPGDAERVRAKRKSS